MKEFFVENMPLPRTYSSKMILMEKGEGSCLFDKGGKKYLDFGSGISVNSLGYGREDLAAIAGEQMKKLIHVSNLYATGPQVALAEKMTAGSPFAAVHFGNSGTEAVETALKYARLYAYKRKGPGHHKILSFGNCFHGRTMGALSATHTPKYQEPFQPLVPGVLKGELNNTAALENLLDETFAGVILEPLQGEGGLNLVTPDFAGALNRLCARHDIILIADEVQTGMARTGSFYAHTPLGLEPDILCLAKPLAAGLPLSATLTKSKINNLLEIGHHASTFGGGPVTTAVACKVWDLLSEEGFIKEVAEKGEFLKDLLEGLKKKHTFLGEVKGKGLLAGITADLDPGTFAKLIPACAAEGLLILRCGTNVIRIAPPLVITKEELKEGIAILDKVLEAL